MLRSNHLLPALLVGLALTACSKKETPAPESTPAPANATSSSEADSGIRFSHPDETGPTPATTPSSSAATENDTSTTGASGEQKFVPAVRRVYYPAFYPLSLRMEGVEGRIDLGLRVNEQGDVTQVLVLAATADEFKDYAVEAAKAWKFFPAAREGKPVAVAIKISEYFVSEFGSAGLPPGSPLARLTYLNGMYYEPNEEGKLVPANVEVTPLLRPQPPVSPALTANGPISVTLSFTVDTEGRTSSPSIVTSSKSAFDETALETIRFWQFIPKIRNGRPESSHVRLPMVVNPPQPAAGQTR